MHATRPLLLALILLSAPAADALAAPGASEWSTALKGGLSLFRHSQASAPAHMTKPAVRAEVLVELSDRIRGGVELVGTLVSNRHYRLLGAYLVGRGDLYRGSVYRLSAAWGFGAGTSPAIMNADLTWEADLLPWVEIGLAQRWALGSGPWALGVDLMSDNLAAITLAAVVGYRL